ASTLTVSNSPPAVAITGPGSATAGQSQTWTFTSTDPSPNDQAASFTYRIDWDGDGTVDQASTAGNSVSIAHTYGTQGSFTIKATSTDKDAGQSPQATKAVKVEQEQGANQQQGQQGQGGQPGSNTRCRARRGHKRHPAGAARKRRGCRHKH